MKLIAIELSGFRRFSERVCVRLTESVIAIVGPNEAGKSTVLRAISLLNNEGPFEARDKTRRTGVEPKVVGIYELSQADRDALSASEVPQAESVRRCRLIKQADGKFTVELEERHRDLSPRRRLSDQIAAIVELPSIANYGKTPAEKKDRKTRFSSGVAALRSNQQALTEDAIQLVRQVVGEINGIVNQPDFGPKEKADAAEIGKNTEDLIKVEQQWHTSKALPVLIRHKPRAVLFDEQSRELKPNYEIAKVATSMPAGLRNLAYVGEFDLELLKKAVETGDLPVRGELLEQANLKLRELFSQSWVQSDVVPQFDVEGGSLHLLVRTLDRGLCRFDERSDGLRWFIALVAFLTFQHQEGHLPILLVDEAETHLSYDAQASLMEVLERQRVAQKVIYTTHSAGCLPSDLGTGIRAVQALQGERSTIHNGFWKRGIGLSPVYLAMGLAPLAFTTARNELIGEGPSECLLLPTLIRQAMALERLDYQVAPGASNLEPSQLGELVSECGRALFVVDGDDGGEAVRQKLLSGGIAPAKIKSYSDFRGVGLRLEDLVTAEAYCRAFNKELERWQAGTGTIALADIASTSRSEAADAWCRSRGFKSPTKVTLCDSLVEQATGGERIVDPAAVRVLAALHAWAMAGFSPTSGTGTATS